MCGIAGVMWFSSEKRMEANQFDSMVDVLSHRGPDDRGTLYLPNGCSDIAERGLALGHRRLSIIDLSEQGRQPLCNEDQTVWITFNGEIYNYEELKPELVQKGHQFRTATDTEVLVHLYEEYGLEFVHRLNGMFAMAIWDVRKKNLVLLRDRMGKKPLYYRVESDRILYASELKSLLRAPNILRKLDPIALDQYLTCQYVPHPRTIYQGIHKLPPGCLALWSEHNNSFHSLSTSSQSSEYIDFSEPEDEISMVTGQFSVYRYYRPVKSSSIMSFDEYMEEIRNRVGQAVKYRMRSDVPLGAFLSGGIDSSIIVGLMQKYSTQKVKTFSIGFYHKEYDETPFARSTAKRLGTEHEELMVTPDVKGLFPDLVRHYDEPFADSSALPTWYLAQMTRKHVTVALSGDGGDELFAGYDRYKAVRLGQMIDRIPLLLRRFLAGPVRRMIPASISQRSILRRGKRFLEALTMAPLERYLQWIAIFNRQRKNELYTSDYRTFLKELATNVISENGKQGYDILDFFEKHLRYATKHDYVTAITIMDLLTYLPCDLMTKVDMASMYHSLEVRAPFLDRDVVELAGQIPLEYKIKGSKGKYILREAFREYLPPDLENRPKTGFGVPLDHWFRNELNSFMKEILFDPAIEREGIFDMKTIKRLVHEHEKKQFDHAARLWALMIFEFWRHDNGL